MSKATYRRTEATFFNWPQVCVPYNRIGDNTPVSIISWAKKNLTGRYKTRIKGNTILFNIENSDDIVTLKKGLLRNE